MSLADKVTTGTYNFVSLIVKIILLETILLTLSLPAADKTQHFVHLSFNSTLQLISGISSNLQKLLKYFNGTAIIAFLTIPLASFGLSWTTVFPNILDLCSKDLKLLSLAITALKLVASSFESSHKFPVVSEQFELYSIKFYTGMTKSSAASIVVSSIFVIHLVNNAQFVSDICVARAAVTGISPLTEM